MDGDEQIAALGVGDGGAFLKRQVNVLASGQGHLVPVGGFQDFCHLLGDFQNDVLFFQAKGHRPGIFSAVTRVDNDLADPQAQLLRQGQFALARGFPQRHGGQPDRSFLLVGEHHGCLAVCYHGFRDGNGGRRDVAVAALLRNPNRGLPGAVHVDDHPERVLQAEHLVVGERVDIEHDPDRVAAELAGSRLLEQAVTDGDGVAELWWDGALRKIDEQPPRLVPIFFKQCGRIADRGGRLDDDARVVS